MFKQNDNVIHLIPRYHLGADVDQKFIYELKGQKH